MKDDPIAALSRLLARLPGIGAKSGARLAYHIWRGPDRYAQDLAKAVAAVKETVKACPRCGAPDVESPCRTCQDPERDRSTVMVVEGPQDLEALEQTGVYRGLYHVLYGTISPMAGKGPDDLNLGPLFSRARETEIKEIILATNPSVEGDATAAWIEQELAELRPDLPVSRLARGIPTGSEIKYLDPESLHHAVTGRKSEK
jgi:recombination protein RecR